MVLGCTESDEDPSNVRIFLVDILTFDGFFGPKFHILTSRWLPTAVAQIALIERALGLADIARFTAPPPPKA